MEELVSLTDAWMERAKPNKDLDWAKEVRSHFERTKPSRKRLKDEKAKQFVYRNICVGPSCWLMLSEPLPPPAKDM